ncbi:hypothetical protein ES705_37515 [subsurface metagenome]
MRTKRYLKTLDNLIAEGDKIRSKKEVITEKEGMTVEQFEEQSIDEKKQMIKEFNTDVQYTKVKLRKMLFQFEPGKTTGIQLLTNRANNKTFYSISTENNPGQRIKQLIKAKKRIFNALKCLEIDVNINKVIGHLPQQGLLPFKFLKSPEMQKLLEDSNGNSKKNKKNKKLKKLS